MGRISRGNKPLMKTIILSLICLTAFGQPQVGNPVPVLLESLTLRELKQVIQDMGFTPTIGKDAAGKDEYISFRVEGYLVAAELATPKLVWLYTVFSDWSRPPKTTTTVTNEWNRTNRFTTAYVEADGAAVLEMNIWVDGITRGHLELDIKQFRSDVPAWARILKTPKAEGPARVTGDHRAL